MTADFPVLSAGPTPQIRLEDWTFGLQLDGLQLGEWTWAEFQALPQTTIKTDIHCVTKWSKLDTVWHHRDSIRRSADSARARWSSPTACSASLLLEERQMDAEVAVYGRG
jgi:DMSO/TMAO reductase YedYZ molybdopterin-dependent catalytic subunit